MLKYRIRTPEQVEFSYELAGLASRAGAWGIDQALLWALRLSIWGGVGLAGGAIGFAVALLGVFVVDFGYYTGFEYLRAGQTLGKRFFGIRVIPASGGRLVFADVLTRNLLRPVDSLPVGMAIGGVVAFIDPKRRRLGDLLASTVVVRDARDELPQGLAPERARVNSFQDDVPLRGRILNRITREERDLILDLTVRRDQLDPASREELFSRAAAHFRERFRVPDDLTHLSDEQIVLNLALLLRDTSLR